MKRIFTLFMLVASFAIYAQQQQVPLVSVTGEGIVNVVPDEVELQVRIEHEGMNPSTVKMENDNAVNTILNFLKRMEVDEKDIRTTFLNLNKNYDYQTKTYSYTANQSLSITVRDINDYEKIVTGLLEKGLNRIDGIQFKSSEIKKHKEEARKRAVLDAKQKANLYATALEQQIGAAFQISETESNFQPLQKMEMMQTSADSGNRETIAPGEMEISVKVNVSFYLHNN